MEVRISGTDKWDGPFQPAARGKRFVDLSSVNAYRRGKLDSARFDVSHGLAANGVVVRCGRAIAVSIA